MKLQNSYFKTLQILGTCPKFHTNSLSALPTYVRSWMPDYIKAEDHFVATDYSDKTWKFLKPAINCLQDSEVCFHPPCDNNNPNVTSKKIFCICLFITCSSFSICAMWSDHIVPQCVPHCVAPAHFTNVSLQKKRNWHLLIIQVQVHASMPLANTVK